MASISTGTPNGSCATATHVRAGLCSNHFLYSSFIAAKSSMLVKNTYIMSVLRVQMLVMLHTPTLTTFVISDPAASTMALMFLQHCAVFSPMEPSISFPDSSAGSCPLTQICPLALMACEYGAAAVEVFGQCAHSRFSASLCHRTYVVDQFWSRPSLR